MVGRTEARPYSPLIKQKKGRGCDPFLCDILYTLSYDNFLNSVGCANEVDAVRCCNLCIAGNCCLGNQATVNGVNLCHAVEAANFDSTTASNYALFHRVHTVYARKCHIVGYGYASYATVVVNVEVENPSALFLAERQGNVSGSCVFAGIEGSRPLLVEIQSLVSPSGYSTPKRAVVGWDSNRLSMILAVLETRCSMNFSSHDVYLNIAGGLKITEPAADLAVAMAVISSLTNKPLPADMVVFGEIGLSGEIRAVSQPNLRMKEAHKLGFVSAIVPPSFGKDKKEKGSKNYELSCYEIGNVHRLINWFN